MVKKITLIFSLCMVQSNFFAATCVVKKEKKVSVSTLQQQAQDVVGEIVKTSADIVQNTGALQKKCLTSIERVVNGEGDITKTKCSAVELKKIVDELQSIKENLKKLDEKLLNSIDFCSIKL